MLRMFDGLDGGEKCHWFVLILITSKSSVLTKTPSSFTALLKGVIGHGCHILAKMDVEKCMGRRRCMHYAPSFC